MVRFVPRSFSSREGLALTLFFISCLQTIPVSSGAVSPDTGMMRATTLKMEDGVVVRAFAGRAAPPAVVLDSRTGREVHIYEYFPSPNDPFAINPRLQLGEGGYGLKTVDRGLSGAIPSPIDAPWAMNMIPFGVALDGALIDPSGPWYDGGPADPNNPFDRNCTGWEYEVLHPIVRQLVGLPKVVPGHVQPGGLFHYHGYPDLLIANLRAQKRAEADPSGAMAVGYSADGYPIIDYLIDSATPKERPDTFMFSGYVLREGERVALIRTNPAFVPAHNYDGLYVQDYVFDQKRKAAQIEAALAERGEYYGLKADDVRAGRATYVLLDARNGIALHGPNETLAGYPAVHYAYVLTPDWPQVPRMFAFEPDQSFQRIVPFQFEQGMARRFLAWLGAPGPGGRTTLYGNCPPEQRSVHIWERRSPY